MWYWYLLSALGGAAWTASAWASYVLHRRAIRSSGQWTTTDRAVALAMSACCGPFALFGQLLTLKSDKPAKW